MKNLVVNKELFSKTIVPKHLNQLKAGHIYNLIDVEIDENNLSKSHVIVSEANDPFFTILIPIYVFSNCKDVIKFMGEQGQEGTELTLPKSFVFEGLKHFVWSDRNLFDDTDVELSLDILKEEP